MAMAMAAIETRNWDVLVEEATFEEANTSSNDGVLKLAEEGQSVGNKRFEVLLSMHRQEFEQAMTREAREAVIFKILDIVCRQCVPNGRFLKAGRSYAGGVRWQELSSDRAQAFVLDSLQIPSESGAASFPPILEQVDEEEHLDEASQPPHDDSPIPDFTTSASPETIHEEKKRRRRSSLLRRSASESQVPTSPNLEGKKKAMRLGSLLKTGFWKSLRGNKNMVKTPEPLDVLLVESHDAFQPNVTHQVGNNRLSILMEVQCDEYRKASTEDREFIVQELIQSVTSHWGGRFLSVTSFSTSDNDAYQILTEREAPLAVHALFENFLTGGTATAALEALHRSCSEAGIGSTAATAKPPAKRSSAVKKEAVEALHQIQPPPIIESSTGAAVKVEDMRSAAVKSLQKRKHRQGLATRIRTLTTTALTRGVSEPIKKNNYNSKKAAEPTRRRSSSMDRSIQNSDDTTPINIHDESERLANLSAGILGDLLNGLDVSGDLQMSEEEYDDVKAHSAKWL
jgi:hypothetical protein